MNETKDKKVGLVHSISFRLLIYILIMAVVVFGGLITFMITQTRNTMVNVYKNYTQNVAQAAATTVDTNMQVTLNNVASTIEGGDSLTAGDIEN